MKNLDFSFIIPAHNEEKVIGECINSIKKQPFQNKIEIIVINDGSTDKTKNILKQIKRIKIINFEKGHSASFARNRGAEKAKGNYLIFLDADQTLEENFMSKLVKFKEKTNFYCAAMRIVAKESKTIFQKGWHVYRKYNRCAAMIIKKELFDKIKFREDLFYVEDDVLFEEVKKRGYKIEEPGVLVYHIDPKSLNDYYRQRKWQGRGLVLKVFKLKKYLAIRYFIPCIILPLSLINLSLLPIYLLLIWIFFSFKSREIINSFWWVVTDFIGRFISLFWFLVYSIASIIKGKII